jgi:nucleoside-diphosphate-sugar epimerase
LLHVAVDSGISGNPEPYISQSIQSTIDILNTAKSTPSIKRVVMTSSSMAAVPWPVDVEYNISPESYSTEFIERAYQEPFTPDKAMIVYGAAKAKSEMTAFDWMKKEAPRFALSTILPAANFGKSLNGDMESTGAWPKLAMDGDFGFISMVPPRKYTDVPSWPRVLS